MSLLHRVEHMHDIRVWEGETPITSRYTAGLAGERFFREIQEHGRILGTRCAACDVTYVPPSLYCERCFAHLEEWVEVPSTGTVHTFTVLHLDLDGEVLEEPQVLAFVALDGSDPSTGPSAGSGHRSGRRGGLVHFLGEVTPDEVEIGMPVEPVFKKKAERKGSILDIVYFKPV